MAEIRVERKQGTGKWLWIVLLLVVLIGIVEKRGDDIKSAMNMPEPGR